MPFRHILLALAVVTFWGLNFLAIHYSLEHFPPLFLVGLRFLVLAIPALLFVPWPEVKVKHLIGYGLGFGTFQFFGLYLGMAAGFPAGLASLVLQASAPFTVLLGALLLHEKLTARRATGIAIAVAGLLAVGISRGSIGGWAPFLLVVFGALSWALGNLASRQAQTDRPLNLVMWMTVVPPIPMFSISLVLEGPQQIASALATSFSAAAAPAWAGLLYTVVFGTIVGSGIWVWPTRRHPAGVVAPFSMLVPIVGIVAAWLVLGEVPTWLELAGGVLVIGGVLWASTRARAGLLPKKGSLRPDGAEPPDPEPTPR